MVFNRSLCWLPFIALLLASCSGGEPTAPPAGPTLRWVEVLARLHAPVPLPDLDSSVLHGYLQVVNHRLVDSLLLGPETSISLAAFLDDDEGYRRGESVVANGVRLKRANSNEFGFFGYAYESDIPAGSVLRWDARMTRGVSFQDSIPVPAYPEITNMAEYDRISASAGILARTASSPGTGRLYLRIRYDAYRNRAAGGDTADVYRMNPRPPLNAEWYAADDGVVAISPQLLDSLPKNRVYVLTVMRYNYLAHPNSDNGRTGMLAVASYELPVFLKP